MVFWKTAQPAQAAPSDPSAGMDHSEEMLAEVDEPPDELKSKSFWSPPKLDVKYTKAARQALPRRESLLTRQLHSETEHSDEDPASQPPRALSTQSTWSSTSTAELTSDDGRSVPSPAISPPLPPTHIRNALPVHEKPLDKKVEIVGQEDVASREGKDTAPEKSVEATLGRKRCIMFACRGKDEAKPKAASPPHTSTPEKPAETEQPKRKCMIKFACPTRSGSETKPAEIVQAKRPASPPPPERRSSVSSRPEGMKAHRGSDSTVTHASPRSVRRSPSIIKTAPTPTTLEAPQPLLSRKLSNDSDATGAEATRFHEFFSSDDEPEEWVQEVTCHRSRLTVDDTLKKEALIRKACEEVEEEAVEEEEDEEAAEEEANGVVEPGDDEDVDEQDEDDQDDESDDSDAGFHSDDEDGFGASDDEGDESDYEWWKPGGSTAATSVDHLDRLTIRTKPEVAPLGSSLGSASSGHVSPHSSRRHTKRSHRTHRHTPAMPIALRPEEPYLPDSTDFVCGTLDEDRPLEQAYFNRKKDIEAAKHKARPQDIDPSFPTSDPEMDEEDDEDLEDPEESENEDLMHGEMEELDAESTPLKRRPSPRLVSIAPRSPPPPARYHSPPPSKRLSTQHAARSPPPRKALGQSPKRARLPAPANMKRVSNQHTARSPPPRKLFGHSPKHARSPAPVNNMTSPPNTRRSSPTRGAAFATRSHGLAQRPQLTHTASLPRNGGFLLSRMCKKRFEDGNGSDTVGGANTDVPKRGAIDIVKGLEKKRQRRKEKMWQKMCAKNAAKGEKAYKVKPGKGAERMREVGLELQKYHGKGEHILSV